MTAIWPGLGRELSLPVVYRGVTLESGFRIDLLVDDAVVVEVKAVDALQRVHESQVLTYLKLTGCARAFF